MLAPTTNGSNGRDASGRFAPGNAGGPGNPYAKRVARLRTALVQAIKPGDVAEVVNAMLRAAKGGDVAAARLVLSYAIGKPPEPPDDPTDERLEIVVRYTDAKLAALHGRAPVDDRSRLPALEFDERG